jgi:hypothetical protein
MEKPILGFFASAMAAGLQSRARTLARRAACRGFIVLCPFIVVERHINTVSSLRVKL